MVYFLCKAYDSDRQNCYFALSLPVRGAWVEISCALPALQGALCRSPCGERGLKYAGRGHGQRRQRSLPVRGAWVEIAATVQRSSSDVRRSPCGERGLKFRLPWASAGCGRRSPCGERGLKFLRKYHFRCSFLSLPVRGAWVEICGGQAVGAMPTSSLPVRGAWVEMWPFSAFPGVRDCRSPCGERGLK